MLLKTGEQFLESAVIRDELRVLGINVRQEFYQVATVFIAIANRTRTPGDILTAHQLNSLHGQNAPKRVFEKTIKAVKKLSGYKL